MPTREQRIEEAYGAAFGVGPMPTTSKEWFALGYHAALSSPPDPAPGAVAGVPVTTEEDRARVSDDAVLAACAVLGKDPDHGADYALVREALTKSWQASRSRPGGGG